MDVSNGAGKQICCSLKKAKTSDHGRDLISDLPDPILVHILSFLPLKDAIKTVLIRRFGELWRGIQVLDLNSCFYHDCEGHDFGADYFNEKFVNVIRRVLNLHNSSTLDKLSLKFCFGLTHTRDELLNDEVDMVEWETRTAVKIEKLIRYAISRKVKVLDLNLKGCEFVKPWEFYNLPDILKSNHLTCLKLAAFDMTSCKSIDLKSLVVMVLDDVSLSDDLMEAIFLHCPALQDLSLVHCHGFELLNCRNPKLKKLLLSLDTECSPVLFLCPYVLSLDIYGSIKHLWLCNVSSAADVSICLGHFRLCLREQYTHLLLLLDLFSKCKTFSLCTWSIVALSVCYVIGVFRSSFQWKNLTLKLSLTKWHLSGLSLLLNNSQSLETLSIYIYPVNYDKFKDRVPKWIQACKVDDGDSFSNSHEATFPCLETIMICGYADDPYVIQMLEFLLKRATTLQKLVISTNQPFKTTCECWPVGHTFESPRYTTVQLQDLSQKLGSLPRASHEATICFC